MPSAKPNADAMKIEEWTIARVKPYAANAKMHPPAQVLKIVASINKFGFVNPILVDHGGVVVAGHGRLQAALEMGLKKVPVIKLGHLTEDEAKALRIADNSIAESGTSWDADMLEAELAALKAVKFDLEPLGLDSIELPDLEVDPTPPPPRANRSKTTIFLSVKNADAEKARKTVAAALTKARIEHNL
jgi:ParB-like chromosome segregation protein Spo0J